VIQKYHKEKEEIEVKFDKKGVIKESSNEDVEELKGAKRS